ncbi:MAG: transposon-transfer assisting family protein [Clostridia bacterium]|nr:transposon-transfer assisting family protein [Clostridia bacterium]MBR6953936.1 transposon-transfer assisting family protein [Clostridia bacterium]
MTIFTIDELNLITLYDPGSRKGTIEELRRMIGYLMPDETDLLDLAQGVIAKLEGMTDNDFDDLSEELTPEYSPVFPDEDSAWGTGMAFWLDEVDPDDEIE